MIEMLHMQTANFSSVRALDFLERGKLTFSQRLGMLFEDVVAEIFKVLGVELERHFSVPVKEVRKLHHDPKTLKPDFYDIENDVIYDVKLNVKGRNSFEMKRMVFKLKPKETWIIFLIGKEPKNDKKGYKFIDIKKTIPKLKSKGRIDLVEVLDSLIELYEREIL